MIINNILKILTEEQLTSEVGNVQTHLEVYLINIKTGEHAPNYSFL